MVLDGMKGCTLELCTGETIESGPNHIARSQPPRWFVTAEPAGDETIFGATFLVVTRHDSLNPVSQLARLS